MKSIREWMGDAGGDVRTNVGLDSSHVDHDLEGELRPKVRMILDMDRFRSMPRGDLLDKMKAVVTRTVGGNLRRTAPSEIDAVDSLLRDELGPKVERIMDMEDYKSEPREELERKIVSAIYKIAAGLSGGGTALQDNDPVAKEWSAVPSFLRWVEENEAGNSLSEPQHKRGEAGMDLKSVVEKRMMQLAVELETDGKGSRQEVLAAMKAVVDASGKGSEAQPQQPDANKQANQQPDPNQQTAQA